MCRLSGITSICLFDLLAVRDDSPVLRGQDASLVLRLKVWLVKAWEHVVTVVGLQLCVDILSVVDLVVEVLESLAVCHVVRLKLNHGFVLADDLVRCGDVDTVVLPQIFRLLPELLPVDDDGPDQLAFEVEEEALRVVTVGAVLSANLSQGVVDAHFAVERLATFDEAKSECVVDISDKLASVFRLDLGQELVRLVLGVGEAFPLGIDFLFFWLSFATSGVEVCADRSSGHEDSSTCCQEFLLVVHR